MQENSACLLVIGDRVVLRSASPPEAEYALFDIGDIELRSTEPGRVREQGYTTNAGDARSRLQHLGITADVAKEVAAALKPSLVDAYARGAGVRNIGRQLDVRDLLQADTFDGKTYHGVFLDLPALAADLMLEHAGATLQALHLAVLLEGVADDVSVGLSTTAVTRDTKPGARTYRRASFAPPARLLAAIRDLAARPPRDEPRASIAKIDLVAFLRARAQQATDARTRSLYSSLEHKVVTQRSMPEKGPLAVPELWAIEERLERRDLDGVLDAIDEAERQHGRTPGTTYLRARVALLSKLEAPKAVAERVSALALSMTSFRELALLTAEAWLEAGEPRRALPYARDLAAAQDVDEGIIARAQHVISIGASSIPPPLMQVSPSDSWPPVASTKPTSQPTARPVLPPTVQPAGWPALELDTQSLGYPSQDELEAPQWPPAEAEPQAPGWPAPQAPEWPASPSASQPPGWPASPSASQPPGWPASPTASQPPGWGSPTGPQATGWGSPTGPQQPRSPQGAAPPTGPQAPGWPASQGTAKPAREAMSRPHLTPPPAAPFSPAPPPVSRAPFPPAPPPVSRAPSSAPTAPPDGRPFVPRVPSLVGMTSVPASIPPPAETPSPKLVRTAPGPRPTASRLPLPPPVPVPASLRPAQRMEPRISETGTPRVEMPFSTGTFSNEAPKSSSKSSAPPTSAVASRRPRITGARMETRPPVVRDPRAEPDVEIAIVLPASEPPSHPRPVEDRPTPLRPPSAEIFMADDPAERFMRGASLPPYRHEDPAPLLPKAPLFPRLDTQDALAEHLPLPAGFGSDHPRPLDALPSSVIEARIQFTLLARSLGVDYREKRGIALRTDLGGIEAMQSVLLDAFPHHLVRTPEEAMELRRHGALLSEILARRLGAEWLDITPNELGYWVMIVPPDTRVWPFGRVLRLVARGHKERDLVSYFLELSSRARRL